MKQTISELESSASILFDTLLQQPLPSELNKVRELLFPEGFRPVVHLTISGKTSPYSDAASNWEPMAGEIVIHLKQSQSNPELIANPVRTPEKSDTIKPRFRPVPVRGEPVSTTILRDRG